MMPLASLIRRSHMLIFAVCAVVCVGIQVGCSDRSSSVPTARDQAPRAVAETTSPAPSAADSPSEPQLQQGIDGQVVKLVGDFTLDPPLGEIVPEAAPVHAFRGRLAPFDVPDPRHAALVKIVQPDRDGRFRLPLPPGEYTLVAEIDGRLYLNNQAEDGFWTSVIVKPGEWTEFKIENVLEATF